MSRRSRFGFTIVELLISLVISLVLFTLLSRALNCGSREAAREYQCRNNLRQLGMAMRSYHEMHNTFPPGIVSDASRNDSHCSYTAAEEAGQHSSSASGWLFLLPYLEAESHYSAYNQDLGCATAANSTAVAARITALLCPGNPNGGSPVQSNYYPGPAGPVDYALSAGASALLTCASPFGDDSKQSGYPASLRSSAGVFNVNSSVALSMIRDGAAITLLAGDAASGFPHGLPEFGGAEPTTINGSTLVEQAWSQGYLGTTGGKGGYGSVFAATALDAWQYTDGSLSPPDGDSGFTPLPMHVGEPAPIRGTTYRASLPAGIAASKDRRPNLPSSAISISPFRSHHENRCNFVFADGSARGLTPDIDARIYVGLSTVAGGDAIGDEGR